MDTTKEQPPGIKLLKVLKGHSRWISGIAWSPDGSTLATVCAGNQIFLWSTEHGEIRRTLQGIGTVYGIAWSPDSRLLAYSNGFHIAFIDANTGELRTLLEERTVIDRKLAWSIDSLLAVTAKGGPIRIYNTLTNKLIREFESVTTEAVTLRFSPDGHKIAVAKMTEGRDYLGTKTSQASSYISLWESHSGKNIGTIAKNNCHSCFAWSNDSQTIAAASSDFSINLWNSSSLEHFRTLEGHTSKIQSLSFSADGALLASQSSDGTIRLWSSKDWTTVAIFHDKNSVNVALREESFRLYGGDVYDPEISFHPQRPILVSTGLAIGSTEWLVSIWETDVSTLLEQRELLEQHVERSVTYTSAKIVLVGDSGVGKTGLGWRLTHGEFKEHSSTHGQQFWVLNELSYQRRDGTQCEAVLWDLAGQPDYRLIHALFLDDTDLSLLVFDPTHAEDPLAGIEYWLKQLKCTGELSEDNQMLLVAARSDRGTARITVDELDDYCMRRGIAAHIHTSAKSGEGIDALLQHMKQLIQWDKKPATVTTLTFKRIKDFVLELKEDSKLHNVIITTEFLQRRLAASDSNWRFVAAEMLTAIGHLANHGYVSWLKTSRGEPRILLRPDLLNNLAASIVLEARRNPKGLGSLEEHLLLSGEYRFTELKGLEESEQAILVDSATVLFLEHNVCFRQTDPLRGRTYLVFPELINLKRPMEDVANSVDDGVAYTVSGPIENVYASLVVLMGYTQTFTRTNQWRNHARYEIGNGQVCGFRLEEERPGELDFLLYFGTDTPAPMRMLFQSLFENFLAGRNLNVQRFEPVVCSRGHSLNRVVVREQLSIGSKEAFCSRCGDRISLPDSERPIQLSKKQTKAVEVNRRAADQRSRFEQVLFRIKTYVTENKIVSPECFVSYAWGNLEHERWVEKSLATDLQKAGISVVLDRWENSRIGASVPRFVVRVANCERIIVVGTTAYRVKYDNLEPMRGFVVAAEGDLIGKRMIGTENQKASVLPVLLEGTEESSFPQLLHGRVYADFRNAELYCVTALELILSIYQIDYSDTVAIDLRDTMRHGP